MTARTFPDIDHKVILVTGASSGTGEATGQRLSSEGTPSYSVPGGRNTWKRWPSGSPAPGPGHSSVARRHRPRQRAVDDTVRDQGPA